MAKYLDYGGLSTAWTRTKSWVISYVKFFINKELGGGGSSTEAQALNAQDPKANTYNVPFTWYPEGGTAGAAGHSVGAGYTIKVEADSGHANSNVCICLKEDNLSGLANGVGSAEYTNNTAGTQTVVVGASDPSATLTITISKSAADRLDDIEAAIVSSPDTKDTTGTTADASKLYLTGAKAQGSASTPYGVTYTQSAAYITAGKVYSNSKETVNLSDTQSLTNKTYNGLTLTKAATGFTVAGGTTSKTLTVPETYTLGNACEKTVDTSIGTNPGVNLPTSTAVASYVETAINNALTGKIQYTVVQNYESLPATGAEGTVYLVPNGEYKYTLIESPASGANPSMLGWYVWDVTTGTYVASQDTTVQTGRNYYKRSTVYDEYIWVDSISGYTALGAAAIDLGSLTTEEISYIIENTYIE